MARGELLQLLFRSRGPVHRIANRLIVPRASASGLLGLILRRTREGRSSGCVLLAPLVGWFCLFNLAGGSTPQGSNSIAAMYSVAIASPDGIALTVP